MLHLKPACCAHSPRSAILSGLVVAQDYRRGQELVRDRDFVANQEFFQSVFEIGRRCAGL